MHPVAPLSHLLLPETTVPPPLQIRLLSFPLSSSHFSASLPCTPPAQFRLARSAALSSYLHAGDRLQNLSAQQNEGHLSVQKPPSTHLLPIHSPHTQSRSYPLEKNLFGYIIPSMNKPQGLLPRVWDQGQPVRIGKLYICDQLPSSPPPVLKHQTSSSSRAIIYMSQTYISHQSIENTS